MMCSCVAIALALLFFVGYLVLPWAVRGVVRGRFLARIRCSGCVCLTFDDGPHPEATPRIQALLDGTGVKGTFFVTGQNAEEYPEIVQSLQDGGHEIGEHSCTHTHPWKTGPVRSWRDISAAEKVLGEAVGGLRPELLRPPYGKLNLATLLYAVVFRKKLAFWDIDPRDYEQTCAEVVAREVLGRLREGCVILLHDGRSGQGGDVEVTVRAVEEILRQLRESPFRLTTVSEALARRG